MSHITVDDVINKRQNELVAESYALNEELRQLEERIESVKRRLAEIEVEYRILEEHNDRAAIVTYTKETVTVHKQRDRIMFEDALKKIFDQAGRPMKLSEIIAKLAQFGWQWSNYAAAHNYITRSGQLEQVTRGIYQLVRTRF